MNGMTSTVDEVKKVMFNEEEREYYKLKEEVLKMLDQDKYNTTAKNIRYYNYTLDEMRILHSYVNKNWTKNNIPF